VTPAAVPSGWWDPYWGLVAWAQDLLWVLLVVALLALVVFGVVVSVGLGEPRRQARGAAQGPEETGARESDYLWVFVVPALNEEVTVADSVARLAAVRATHRVILVVDDGSDDATPEILAGLDVPGLRVLRREPPRARCGKAAALDDAWDHVGRVLLEDPEYRAWSRDDVIVCVVDADGRVAPDAPVVIAPQFADPRTGGVQVLVRIYNRARYLTWAQDVEFAVSAFVYQLGRSRWGTANMGGNGQANRLSALDDVVTDDAVPDGVTRGPWRDRLTEDQDIGVRMVQAGWRNRQTVDTVVEQQGVTNLRRLYRQRTRWAQGAWQALGLLGGVGRADVPAVAKLDAALYLLTPALQLAMGAGLVAAVCFAVFLDVSFFSVWWPTVVFFVAIAVVPTFVALLLSARRRRTGPLSAVVGLVPYVVYSWLIYPAIANALLRQLRGARGWAKTAREPLHANLPDDVDPTVPAPGGRAARGG